MARSLDARLAKLTTQLNARAEVRYQRRMVAAIAAEYGLDPAELLAEAEAVFRLSVDAQLAYVERWAPDAIAQGMCSATDIDILKSRLRLE